MYLTDDGFISNKQINHGELKRYAKKTFNLIWHYLDQDHGELIRKDTYQQTIGKRKCNRKKSHKEYIGYRYRHDTRQG